jgi:hypothetical protein
VAITSKGVIGWELYEKEAINGERLTAFINNKIAGKYENHVIVMDNTVFHKTEEVRKAIKDSKNTVQYSVAYLSTLKSHRAVFQSVEALNQKRVADFICRYNNLHTKFPNKNKRETLT